MATATEGIISIFKVFDENNARTLSLDEFSDLIMRVSTLSQKDINRLFKAADTDGNGVLDYTEFITWVFESKKSGKKKKQPTTSPKASGQPKIENFKVSVSRGEGEPILDNFQLLPDDPIAKLREAAQEALGMSPKAGFCCQLFMQGNPLDDGECAKDAGLKDGCDVRGVVKPVPEVEDMIAHLQQTIKYLEENDKDVVQQAWAPPIESLQQVMFLGKTATPAVSLYRRMLHHEKLSINLLGAWCLKHVGKAALPAMHELGKAIQTGDAELRSLAAHILGTLAKEDAAEVLQIATSRLNSEVCEPTRTLVKLLFDLKLTATIAPELVQIIEGRAWPSKDKLAIRALRASNREVYRTTCQADLWDADKWAEASASLDARLKAAVAAQGQCAQSRWLALKQKAKVAAKSKRTLKMELQTIDRLAASEAAAVAARAMNSDCNELAFPVPEALDPTVLRADARGHTGFFIGPHVQSWNAATTWNGEAAWRCMPQSVIAPSEEAEAPAALSEKAMKQRQAKLRAHFRKCPQLLMDANSYCASPPFAYTTECRTYARFAVGQLAKEFFDGKGCDIVDGWFPMKGSPLSECCRLVHTLGPVLPEPDLAFLKVTDADKQKWAKQNAKPDFKAYYTAHILKTSGPSANLFAKFPSKAPPKFPKGKANFKPYYKAHILKTAGQSPSLFAKFPAKAAADAKAAAAAAKRAAAAKAGKKFPICPPVALKISLPSGLPWSSAMMAASC